ncbi:unnamed protein product [Effrenium voratum]|nr:unnamed protein product [Effrenium voratum]
MAVLETWQAVDVATVQQWLAQPQRLSKTTDISLPSKGIGDDAAALLGALTLRCCQLHTLRLSGNCIGDHGAQCLAESLKLSSSSLQILDLSGNCFTAVGAKHLASTFFQSSGGEHAPRLLDLSGNPLDDHGVAGVARCAAAGAGAARTLLRLEDVSCTSQGLPELLRCAFAGLDLSRNKLGLAGGMSTLAAQKRKGWRSLRISDIGESEGNPRKPLMLAPLARSLAECLRGKLLTDLECGSNGLGEQACCQLAEALGSCEPTLRRLAMPQTGFGLRGCAALGQSLWPDKGAAGLRILDLSCNQLVDASIELLSDGLSRCGALQEMQLADNAISCRGIAVLANALHAQRQLNATEEGGTGVVVLSLRGNPVGSAGAKALAALAAASTQDKRCLSLDSPWGLESLDLAQAQVGREGRDSLTAAVAARAALADAASRRLAEEPLDEAGAERLRSRWGLRRPSALSVIGLDLGSETAELQQAASGRFAACWPLAGSGLTCRESLWRSLTEEPSSEEAHEAALDLSLYEGYFGNDGETPKERPAATAKSATAPAKAEKREDSSTKGSLPPAKGKGKQAAKGPAAPPKGKGKGPPKGKGNKEAGEKEAKPKASAAPAPFGRRMHWVQPRYSQPDHDTVFGEAPAIDFDADVLASLMSGEGKGGGKRRSSIQKKADGIKVLDASRAQNIAIVLSKLPVTSVDLCDALECLDFGRLALSDDLVELLSGVLPTFEETQKLKVHKDAPEVLRDIEQKVLPFCFLPRATARLRLLQLASSHADTAQLLQQRCLHLKDAATEAMTSRELRQVFTIILRVGNYINHGMKVGGASGFSIETLPAITSFKLGNVSTLHFLCSTLRQAHPNFADLLASSLRNIPAAAREKSSNLRSSVQAFQQEVDFADRELQHIEDGTALASMQLLAGDLHREQDELQEALTDAFEACNKSQRYFCTEEAQNGTTPPYENFFQHLATFLESLRKAWQETEPKRKVERTGSMSQCPLNKPLNGNR